MLRRRNSICTLMESDVKLIVIITFINKPSLLVTTQFLDEIDEKLPFSRRIITSSEKHQICSKTMHNVIKTAFTKSEMVRSERSSNFFCSASSQAAYIRNNYRQQLVRLLKIAQPPLRKKTFT